VSTSATPEPVIRQIVEAMRTPAGPHAGFRPVHAKALVCSGTFRASADAPRVTRAPHFTRQSVPTVVRWANANWNPDVHDGVPNVRSMAVKFQLSDGKSADILANSVEGFRYPQDPQREGALSAGERPVVPVTDSLLAETATNGAEQVEACTRPEGCGVSSQAKWLA
jgi:hypothetical protein